MICKFFSKFNFFSVVFISCSDKNPRVEAIEKEKKYDPLREIISGINKKGSAGLLQEKKSDFNNLFDQILSPFFETKESDNIKIEIEESDKKKFKYDELDSKKKQVIETLFKYIEKYYPEVIQSLKYILNIGGLHFITVDDPIKKEVDNWDSDTKSLLEEKKNSLEKSKENLTKDKKNLEEQIKNKNEELSNINKTNLGGSSDEEKKQKKIKIDKLKEEIENLKYTLSELIKELEKINDSLKILKERESNVPEKKKNYLDSIKSKYIQIVYQIFPVIHEILNKIIEPFDKEQKFDFVNSNEYELKKYLEDKDKNHTEIFYKENIVNSIIKGLKKLIDESFLN